MADEDIPGGSWACPVHYVAGSFPKANEQARRAANELVDSFDCQSDTPSFDSTIGRDFPRAFTLRRLSKKNGRVLNPAMMM